MPDERDGNTDNPAGDPQHETRRDTGSAQPHETESILDREGADDLMTPGDVKKEQGRT